jgi:hypothetical protein
MVSTYLQHIFVKNHKNFQEGSGSGQLCNKWPPGYGFILRIHGSTTLKIGNLCKKRKLGCDENLVYRNKL